MAPFEDAVAALSRRGRPPIARDRIRTEDELALTRALLSTATQLLSHLPLRRRPLRQLLVGAWLRLKDQHNLTQDLFCRTFSLRPRTFRHWLKQGVHSEPVAPAVPSPKPPRKRPPRRPRFGFDVNLPETLFAGDTTDLSAFEVPLKLVASQDIGGRDVSLLDSILIDDHESAQHVSAVLREALADKPGATVITDQGTPYLADATRIALEDLEADHAPQREADPIGKATLERAFRTAKDIARPLLAITNRIAQVVPSLRDPSLAKASATLVITAILRAYQHGARAARRADLARDGLSIDELSHAAKESRQHARAEQRSRRLFLEHIHELYAFPLPLARFRRAFRLYPLEVLKQAEQALRDYAPRPDIRNLYRYFSAIVRRLNDEDSARRRRVDDSLRNRDKVLRQLSEREAHFSLWYGQPLKWLDYAFGLLSAWWLTRQDRFVCDSGPGHGALQGAVSRLVKLLGPHSAWAAALGAFHSFSTRSSLSDKALSSIEHLLKDALNKEAGPNPAAPSSTSAILALAGENRRPPPSSHLRF